MTAREALVQEAGDWDEEEIHTYAVLSLQYASQLYGDEQDLLPVDDTKVPLL